MSTENKTPVIVAVIGVVGVLGGAFFANWDKIFKPETRPAANTVIASTSNIQVPPIANEVPTAAPTEKVETTTAIGSPAKESTFKPGESESLSLDTQKAEKIIDQKTTRERSIREQRTVRRRGGFEETISNVVRTDKTVTVTVTQSSSSNPYAYSVDPNDYLRKRIESVSFTVGNKFFLELADRESPFTFVDVPCPGKSVKVRIRFTYTMRAEPQPRVLERDEVIDCENPKININLEDGEESRDSLIHQLKRSVRRIRP